MPLHLRCHLFFTGSACHMADTAIAQGTGRSYEEAISALNQLITRRLDYPLPDPVTGLVNYTAHFQALFKYLKILELEEPLSQLSVIHVAGTKGKGSTCAFIESILRAAGFQTGLFTSPHLFDVCERFRFNGVQISKERFLHHFWWCWDRLQADGGKLPGFFRFFTLLGFRMFTEENVDVAILEVGLGGRLDATNIELMKSAGSGGSLSLPCMMDLKVPCFVIDSDKVKSPAVCGIASLGYDHMELLGYTLAKIAWEKAGIFKAGVPAFTAPQPEEAMKSLRKRANELGITLEVAPKLECYGLENVQLGLGGDHQRINAALAIALCKQWVKSRAPSEQVDRLQQVLGNGGLPDAFVKGLETTSWPGRAEVFHDPSGRLSFYLDGAHSPESMEACANWFCSAVKAEEGSSEKVELNGNQMQSSTSGVDEKWNAKGFMVRRVLLFNCMPKRDPVSLLQPVINTCMRNGVHLHMAFFVPPYSSYTSVDTPVRGSVAAAIDVSWQQELQRHWEPLRQVKIPGGSGIAALAQEERCEPCTELWTGLKNAPESSQHHGSILGPSSAVMRSLPAALDWFRSCTTHHPQLRIQVLVTGSLYLVGDLLRLLKH